MLVAMFVGHSEFWKLLSLAAMIVGHAKLWKLKLAAMFLGHFVLTGMGSNIISGITITSMHFYKGNV